MKKLEDPELKILWYKYLNENDLDARNDLVENYSYIIEIIAKRIRGMYQQFGDFDDMVNEGIIALIDAVSRFDISKNVKFETYASIRIRGSIIDYVRKQSWIPRRVTKNKKDIREAEKALSNELGRMPNDVEISSYMSMDVNEYNKILFEINKATILSFEDNINKLNVSTYAFTENSKNSLSLPENELDKKEEKKILENAINSLNDIEKLVISLYYKDGIKFKEIAKILEVSNSRVSQIHTRALKKLNDNLEKM